MSRRLQVHPDLIVLLAVGCVANLAVSVLAAEAGVYAVAVLSALVALVVDVAVGALVEVGQR